MSQTFTGASKLPALRRRARAQSSRRDALVVCEVCERRVVRRITLDDLRRHVIELWGCEDGIVWKDFGCFRANHDTGTIEIHPITSEERYASAVHEIGHIRNGCPDVADDLPENEIKALLITDERRAWDWARTNSPIWTPAMDREAARSLRFYEVGPEEPTYELVREFVDEFCATDGNCGAGIGDALIRYAVEFYSIGDPKEDQKTRKWLIELIDENLPRSAE